MIATALDYLRHVFFPTQAQGTSLMHAMETGGWDEVPIETGYDKTKKGLVTPRFEAPTDRGLMVPAAINQG